jgi:threonine dehydratase
MLLLTVTGWLNRREREMLAYLIEENRVLRRQLGGRRLPPAPRRSAATVSACGNARDLRRDRLGGVVHEEWAMAEAARDGRPFLSPYDDDAIIAAGGGSLAAEVFEDVPGARTFLIPTGGAGLAAGFAFYALSHDAECRIICCQHALSPGVQRSMEAGRAVRGLRAIETSAGAIEGGVADLPFEVLRDRVGLAHVAVAHVTEAEIEGAVRWMLENHQYLVEPASAAAVAAVLTNGRIKIETPAVIVLTGRNVSLKVISKILRSRS